MNRSINKMSYWSYCKALHFLHSGCCIKAKCTSDLMISLGLKDRVTHKHLQQKDIKYVCDGPLLDCSFSPQELQVNMSLKELPQHVGSLSTSSLSNLTHIEKHKPVFLLCSFPFERRYILRA